MKSLPKLRVLVCCCAFVFSLARVARLHCWPADSLRGLAAGSCLQTVLAMHCRACESLSCSRCSVPRSFVVLSKFDFRFGCPHGFFLGVTRLPLAFVPCHRCPLACSRCCYRSRVRRPCLRSAASTLEPLLCGGDACELLLAFTLSCCVVAVGCSLLPPADWLLPGCHREVDHDEQARAVVQAPRAPVCAEGRRGEGHPAAPPQPQVRCPCCGPSLFLARAVVFSHNS